MNLMKIFGMGKGAQKPDSDLGRLFNGIETILAGATDSEVKWVTAYAGLLGKVAYADMDVSQEEIKRIGKVLTHVLHLSSVDAERILEIMQQHHAELYSIEDYIYVRLINEACGKDEKLALVEAMFTVAAADESVSGAEDAVIRVVSNGLQLSHKDFVQVRARFSAHLDVLKGL
jgi:uncharacterized tellurite resistance protein B-like protein